MHVELGCADCGQSEQSIVLVDSDVMFQQPTLC